jgi:quercetin dioxygenase-like cupin family protein
MRREGGGASTVRSGCSDLGKVVAELLPETGSVEVQRDTPGREHALHTHPTDETLHIVAGSITFEVAGERSECGPGDRLLLPAETPHASMAGPEGCLYVIALRMVDGAHV